jgi:hypothetical protein
VGGAGTPGTLAEAEAACVEVVGAGGDENRGGAVVLPGGAAVLPEAVAVIPAAPFFDLDLRDRELGRVLSRGIRIFAPQWGQMPFRPAWNPLTFSLCPFGQ